MKAAAEAKKHEEESTLVVAMIKKADEEANTQKIEKTRKAHKMAREVLDYNKKLIVSGDFEYAYPSAINTNDDTL